MKSTRCCPLEIFETAQRRSQEFGACSGLSGRTSVQSRHAAADQPTLVMSEEAVIDVVAVVTVIDEIWCRLEQ